MRASAKVAAGRAICRREIGSASATVLGRTSDNTLTYLTLTAVYDYRPSSNRVEHLDAQGRPHNEARGTLWEKEQATVAKHTWWPEHLHVSTTVGTLCRAVALTTLSGFDARAIEARGGGRLLAGAAHERASCVLPLWGVTSMAMMARAWVVRGANSPSALLCPRPLVPSMVVDQDVLDGIVGLPDRADAVGLVDFCAKTALRDDIVRHAIAAGVDPYTVQGARHMAAHLWRAEALCRSAGRTHEADRALALCHDLCDARAF
ncbi:hypothetical protein pqer_cds_916 [Pandoravirus quercus]|uniref:Uncharacterized protein n=1 Tax=Pandoravirus quercus TaxID=2107709 RepID=A0A2U7UA62_9VIRU|nr:hypothetical protein pqer_cds_916 [Pandoravirus quercus]AVK75338.1 hypothetical protein pqer_cds_916 [Pandoravirus quercus]